MVGMSDRAHRLDKALAAAPQGRWDICLIDCPPSLGLLTVNALVAARYLLVPLQCEFFALEGLSQLLTTVERIRLAFNPSLSILGVALTMFDRRNNLSQAVADDVRACLGDVVFEIDRAAQRTAVGSAQPRPAGADLRPQVRGVGSVYSPCARTDRPPAPAGGGGMSAERPAKGLGMGLSALLGEAARTPAAGEPAEGVREIEIARIRPNPRQPRMQVRRRGAR